MINNPIKRGRGRGRYRRVTNAFHHRYRSGVIRHYTGRCNAFHHRYIAARNWLGPRRLLLLQPRVLLAGFAHTFPGGFALRGDHRARLVARSVGVQLVVAVLAAKQESDGDELVDAIQVMSKRALDPSRGDHPVELLRPGVGEAAEPGTGSGLDVDALLEPEVVREV